MGEILTAPKEEGKVSIRRVPDISGDRTGKFDLGRTVPFKQGEVTPIFDLSSIAVSSMDVSPSASLNRTSGSGLHTRACGC